MSKRDYSNRKYKNKTCEICGEVYVPTNGRQKRCGKECNDKYRDVYLLNFRKNNKDKIKEDSKHWYENNKERKKAASRNWLINNREKNNELVRQWRKNNPEKVKEMRRRYYENNVEKVKDSIGIVEIIVRDCDVCGKFFKTKLRIQKRCSMECRDKRKKDYASEYRKNNSNRAKELASQWRKNNPDRCKELNRQWREDNLGKSKELNRQWRKDNLGKSKELNRQWRKDNPDRCKKLSRQWYEKNIDKHREYGLQWAIKNSDKKNKKSAERYRKLGGRKPRRYWPDLYLRDGPVCGICKEFLNPIIEDFHVDHIIPVSKGGSSEKENLQISHSVCNLEKHANILES